MAITPGRSSNNSAQSVDTTWTDILSTNGTGYPGCEELLIMNLETSAVSLLVSVHHRAGNADSTHRITNGTPDDSFPLAPGESITFAGSIDNKITRAMVKAASATANLKWTATKP